MKKRKLIQDVFRDTSLSDSELSEIKLLSDTSDAMKLSTDILIDELYSRGVSIKQIFARYYELDAHADAHSLTVEDVELAVEPYKSKEERPF